MQKFNTSDIFTGYLKQLLKNFNLPKLKVYTKEHKEYFEKYGIERSDILNTITEAIDDKGEKYFPNDTHYIPYIKEGKIQEYINNEWMLLGERKNKRTNPIHYDYGTKLLNYTKNLVVKNNVYDSYTHEYLGDYLRFQRDYNNLDLMPLYNCFSNRACENLIIKGEISTVIDRRVKINATTAHTTTYNTTFEFNTKDPNYKIYMMPIKMFKTYTIAIDSDQPVEFCCGIYGNYQDTRSKFNALPRLTYQRVNQSQFTKPFLYTKLSLNAIESWTTTPASAVLIDDLKKEIVKNESDLKLFIKIPFKNNSTITILEGDYCSWNDHTFSKIPTKIYDKVIYITENNFKNSSSTDEETKQLLLDKTIYESQYTAYDFILTYNTDPKTNYKNYKFYKIQPGDTIKLNEVNMWESLSTLSSKPDRFKVITDSEAYTYQSNDGEKHYSIIETAERYRRKQNIYNPYIAYYNNNLNQLLVISYSWNRRTNYSIINVEPEETKSVVNAKDIPLITPLQLLRFNTKEQHPFADRLIEYLLDNVIIDSTEEVPNNVRRVQKALLKNKDLNNYKPAFKGIWDYKINKLMYAYINTHQNTYETNHDILGYIDKDVEKYYTYKDGISTNNLSNIELEEGDK